MSEKAIKEVIAKALTDDDFRKQLLSKPESALAGYDLTDEEKKAWEKFEGMRIELIGRAGEREWGMVI